MTEEELLKLSDNLFTIIDSLKIINFLPSDITISEEGIAFVFVSSNGSKYIDIECLYAGDIVTICKNANFTEIWELHINNIIPELNYLRKFYYND